MPHTVTECALDRGEAIDKNKVEELAAYLAVGSHMSFQGGGYSPRITVSRPCDSADRLLELANVFGGDVRCYGRYEGVPTSHAPAAAWYLPSHLVVRAVRLLMSVDSGARDRFKVLADSYDMSKAQRKERKSALVISGWAGPIVSWSQMGGIFDAKGSIVSQRGGTSLLRLKIISSNVNLVTAVRDFLESEGYKPGSVRSCAYQNRVQYHIWNVNGLEPCQELLTKLMPFLIQRKRRAETALELRPDNVEVVRKKLYATFGRQKTWHRGDVISSAMAITIKNKQLQLWRAKKSRFASEERRDGLRKEISDLRDQQAKYLLDSRTEMARGKVREALAGGAVLGPLP